MPQAMPAISPLRHASRPAWLLLFWLVAISPLAAEDSLQTAAGTDNAAAPRSDEFDDAAEPFVAAHQRSSRAEDRVKALALFAAGRVAEQKQEYPSALRCYERAFRFDPLAVPALREIVPLAFNLDRQAEAIRYALIMAERDPTDVVLLRRLAIHLTEEGDTDRALKLYEKALAVHAASGEKASAPIVLLWMEMGRLYFLEKKFNAAARNFDEVSQALTDPEKFGLDKTMQKALLNKAELTYQLFGEGFLEAGRADDALAAFEKSQQIKADNALQLYNLARVDARKKQPAQALAKLETYFDQHYSSQGTGPYQLLADVLDQLGQGKQLSERLEKLRAADAQNMPLAYFLAQRYREANELDKAEPIYQLVLDHQKARPPVEALTGLLDLYRVKKDPAKLLSILGEGVGRGGGSLTPFGDSAKALLANPELTRAVVAEAQRQLTAEPAKIPYGARLAAALLAVELKDFAAATALFESALTAEGAKPSETLVTWGLELFMANQYAEAARVFERGLKDKTLPDDNPSLHFYLAGALEMSGQTDAAIVAARRAADLQKDSARFASRVAWIQFHAKRYDDARQSYLALINRFDSVHDNPEARDVVHESRLVLSNLCVLENKPEESEEWVEQVLDEFPEDAGALNDLGYLWADTGKHLELALDMIQIAVAAEPKNMAYRDSLGWVLFRLGKLPQAVAELKAAATIDEPDGTILDHLAEALDGSGDQEGAAATWKRAAEVFEKRDEPDKAALVRAKIARPRKPPSDPPSSRD
jgi:tetratricopeptide (TPR) repeat protein